MNTMKTLTIQASPSQDQGNSSTLGSYVAQKFGTTTTTRALYNHELPFIQGEFIEYTYGRIEYDDLSDANKLHADLQKGIIAEIKNTEVLILCIPMWNFSEPAIMKAYIDLLIKKPEVLLLDENGYHGQLGNLKAVAICIATGGTGYEDGPMESFEFISGYYEKLFSFLGAQQVKSFFAQGAGQQSVDSEAILAATHKKIDERSKTVA